MAGTETEENEIVSSLIDLGEELIRVTPRPPLRGRMTVVDKVYHQPMKGEAYCCECTFERWLDDDESVYSRKIRASEGWKQIHLGWFSDDGKPVGMLVIRNDEGKYLQRIPSEEEKVSLSEKVLEVGTHDSPLFLVSPGESLRAVPSGQNLFVRCLGGECSFTVFAFPK